MVSVLVVVAAAVLVVVAVVVGGALVVGSVVLVCPLVVGSVVVGGASARAAAAAPLPNRTTAASVAVRFRRATGRDYRSFSNVLPPQPGPDPTISSAAVGVPSCLSSTRVRARRTSGRTRGRPPSVGPVPRITVEGVRVTLRRLRPEPSLGARSFERAVCTGTHCRRSPRSVDERWGFRLVSDVCQIW